MLEIFWPHHTQCSWWNHHCAVAAVIHKPPSDWKWPTGRPNHMSLWIRSETTEHRSFLCVKQGSLSRTLAFNSGHSYAQEMYDTRYDMRCYFNVCSKADTNQLKLLHGTKTKKVKTRVCHGERYVTSRTNYHLLDPGVCSCMILCYMVWGCRWHRWQKL